MKCGHELRSTIQPQGSDGRDCRGVDGVSESKKGEPRCKKCSQPVNEKYHSCDYCGVPLHPDGIYYSTGPRLNPDGSRTRLTESMLNEYNEADGSITKSTESMRNEDGGESRVIVPPRSDEFVGVMYSWVGWTVGSMVFYKIAMDAAFNRDISVVASAILGLMVASSVYISARFYVLPYGRHLARLALGTPSNFFLACVPIWVVSVLSNVILGKLVVFGFSKNLNYVFGRDVFFRFSYHYMDENYIFWAIIGIPITVHLILILLSGLRPDLKKLR